MEVSIIIVNFNTKDLTSACIESVYSQTKKHSFEVILWDNASSDGSSEYFQSIKHKYSNFVVKVSDTNLGFASANNKAAKFATGKLILLLNPDTEVIDSGIDRLVEYALHKKNNAIYGGSTYFSDGHRNTTSCWGKPTVWSMFTMGIGLGSVFRKSRIFNPESFEWWSWDIPREVDIITGCFLLISKENWDSLGGFDMNFFMYGEDADLCFRAAKKGIKCIVYPEAGIIHYEGASENIRADKMIRLFTAKDLLLDKHYTKAVRSYGKIMLTIYSFTRWVISSIIAVLIKKYKNNAGTWKHVFLSRVVK